MFSKLNLYIIKHCTDQIVYVSIDTGIKFFFFEDIPGYVYIVQCTFNSIFFI